MRTTMALLSGILSAIGCYGWKAEPAPLPELLERPVPPPVVRVTLADSFQMELAAPRLAHDTLVGLIPGSDSIVRRVERGRIRKVETRHLDGGMTALAVLGPPAVIGTIVLVVGLNEWNESFEE